MIKYLLAEIDRLKNEVSNYEEDYNKLHDFNIKISERRGQTEWENNMLTAKVHRLENRLSTIDKSNIKMANEVYKISKEDIQLILESLEWMFDILSDKQLEDPEIEKVNDSMVLLRNLKT